jgi:PAS domain S-box-containing protein
MRPLRLSRLLFLRSLVAALLTFAVAYPLLVSWLLPQAGREIEQRQLQLGRAIAGQVQAHLAGPAFALEGIAHALSLERNVNPQLLYALLDGFLEQPGSFSSLYLVNESGRVIAVGLSPARQGLRVDLLGIDLSTHPLWRAAQDDDGLHWTDAFLSTVEGDFTVAVGRRAGRHTLIGEIAFRQLAMRLDAATGDASLRTLLLDRRGRTVADSRDELRARQQDFGYLDFVRGSQGGDGRVHRFQFEGEAMLGTVTTVPQLGWRVLVMRPQQEAYRPARIANLIMLAGLAVAVLIGLGGAAFQARYFGRQFRALADFAAAVGEGRYGQRWTPSRVREVNDLAQSVTQMSSAIQWREQEVAASQAAYRELVDNTSELVLRLDADWRLTYANPALCRLLGVGAADCLGEPMGRWLRYDQEEWQKKVFAELAAGAASVAFECPMVDDAGIIHWVAWTLHTGSDDEGRRRYGAIGHDITERRAASEALQRSEERLRAMLNAATTVAIQWYDGAGRVLYWNPGSTLMYGYTAEEALGRGLDELVYSSEQMREFRAMLQRLNVDGGTEGPVEVALRNRSGETLYVLMSAFSIPARGGGRYFVCIDIDVTERRLATRRLQELNENLEARVSERTAALAHSNAELAATLDHLQLAQEELLRAEKMAALGALVAGVAHELSTPLGNGLMAANTVSDHTRSLRRELESGLRRSVLEQYLSDTEAASRIIERNLERAAELVASFRQVAVDQASSQRRSFTLDELVDEIAMTLRPSFRHQPWQLNVEVEPGLVLDSYPGPLGQVLTNLINTALVHGFDGCSQGSVTVSGRAEGDDRVVLEVRDDGRGIAPENLRRIFDPFFTTRLGQGGSGLGLHIVHSLVVNLLGGSIQVDSLPGRGTCMRVRIPRSAPQAVQGSEAADTPDQIGR